MKKYNPRRGGFGLTDYAILDRWKKDVFGQNLAEGDFVVAVHNNRILPGVVKEFTEKGRVIIKPLESDLGGRRGLPPLKPFKREGYNCMKVDEKQITWSTLSGDI
jgi:hypothetical protein